MGISAPVVPKRVLRGTSQLTPSGELHAVAVACMPAHNVAAVGEDLRRRAMGGLMSAPSHGG
eukprot:3324324-Lingulodinium_polyedra.AAC.1